MVQTTGAHTQKAGREEKYMPPTVGTMYIHVADSYSNSSGRNIVSSVNHSNMMEIIRKGVDSVTTVLEFCIQNTFLRLVVRAVVEVCQ